MWTQRHVSGLWSSDCLVSKVTLESALLLSLISVTISQHSSLQQYSPTAVNRPCVCRALIEVTGRQGTRAAALLSHECPQTDQ